MLSNTLHRLAPSFTRSRAVNACNSQSALVDAGSNVAKVHGFQLGDGFTLIELLVVIDILAARSKGTTD